MSIQERLQSLADPVQAVNLAHFFKTGPGQYGEGDRFLGIKVPTQRQVAKEFKNLSLGELETLLASPLHECRLTALMILVEQYKKADATVRQTLYNFYLAHTHAINNWDFVDLTAPNIVGQHLLNDGKWKVVLPTLAKSANLWERRIAVLATYSFIRADQSEPILTIAALLLLDKHDLIHKAVGWMLRELGKRNMAAETAFLDQHFQTMPRTMLRYAIEKFPEPLRQHYLNK